MASEKISSCLQSMRSYAFDGFHCSNARVLKWLMDRQLRRIRFRVESVVQAQGLGGARFRLGCMLIEGAHYVESEGSAHGASSHH
jgi:hypothetical protein